MDKLDCVQWRLAKIIRDLEREREKNVEWIHLAWKSEEKQISHLHIAKEPSY